MSIDPIIQATADQIKTDVDLLVAAIPDVIVPTPIVIVPTPLVPTPEPGGILFDGSRLASWPTVQGAMGAVTEIRDPTSRSGYAIKLDVSDGDLTAAVSGGRNVNRHYPAATVMSPPVFTPGADLWASWSTVLPTDLPASLSPHGGQFFQIMEVFGPPWGSPTIMLSVMDKLDGRGNCLNFNNGNSAVPPGSEFWATKVDLGTPLEFEMHVHMSTDPTVGLVELWYQSEQVMSQNYATIVQGANSGKYNVLYLDQYRQKGLTPAGGQRGGAMTVLHRDLVIGSSQQ